MSDTKTSAKEKSANKGSYGCGTVLSTTLQPGVAIEINGQKILLSVDVARSFATSLEQTCAMAEAESMIARWLYTRAGVAHDILPTALAEFRDLYSHDLYEKIRKPWESREEWEARVTGKGLRFKVDAEGQEAENQEAENPEAKLAEGKQS